MSGDEGSTTGQETPSQASEPPSPSDAMSGAEVSTEYLAEQERQEADRADRDAATQRERVEEGRLHHHEGRTRETGGA